ncbi:uncharacterized protein K02A2.6-like [Teleopsis dalmanni]|uniref:uncharacterized protein K02A2.6-like n=1 Tax=Teleopsis dalmanni TaxID=139649 RepID=UPI0018CE8793|nr:uncharacterized protein K02A2.6-like [Teleopsis dalmanni]
MDLKFIKSKQFRQVPFALIPQYKKEINRLKDAEILKPVQFSEWASPIVLAKKPDGSVRICADFKATVNPQIDVEPYPSPLRESLFHTIRHGKLFTKIDLKGAYLQMELDDETKKVLVIKTPIGLFQYQRLPYGIASALAIFQRYLEQLLENQEGCGNFLDDIITTASSTEEHIKRVKNATELAHYREDLQLHVAADASSYGIGAVLSHILADSSEKPIAFASKTLDRHQVR